MLSDAGGVREDAGEHCDFPAPVPPSPLAIRHPRSLPRPLPPQADCPSARVVYCSATGASSLQNMGYMQRLGLWGAATPFADFRAFTKALGQHGKKGEAPVGELTAACGDARVTRGERAVSRTVGAMELVALDLKRRGMYLSRQLSFSAASFDKAMVDLNDAQRKMYDEARR